MGGITSYCVVSEDKKRSKVIDRQNKKDFRMHQDQHRILLLGPGESGKSTVFRQFRKLYLGGFPKEDQLHFRQVIHHNVIEGMREIIDATPNNLKLKSKVRSSMRVVESLPAGTSHISPALGMHIMRIWQCEEVQHVFEEMERHKCRNNLAYYLDSISRISKKNFLPSDQDIINSRVKTTGIEELEFEHHDNIFRVIDVGGQRCERHKWLHVFNDVLAVVFIVAASGFNETLVEDEEMNRLEEAIELFKNVSHLKVFKDVTFVLFLNKIDLFQQKIANGEKLSETFPEFKEDYDYNSELALNFIIREFKHAFPDLEFVHPTCATDTNMMGAILESVQEAVRGESMIVSGLV